MDQNKNDCLNEVKNKRLFGAALQNHFTFPEKLMRIRFIYNTFKLQSVTNSAVISSWKDKNSGNKRSSEFEELTLAIQ